MELLKDTLLNSKSDQIRLSEDIESCTVYGRNYVVPQHTPDVAHRRVVSYASSPERRVYWRYGDDSDRTIIENVLQVLGHRGNYVSLHGVMTSELLERLSNDGYSFHWVQGPAPRY